MSTSPPTTSTTTYTSSPSTNTNIPPPQNQQTHPIDQTSQATNHVAQATLPPVSPSVPSLTLSSRVNQTTVGTLTNSQFTSIKIADANGKVREYWVWARVDIEVDGKKKVYQPAILKEDVDSLKNALTPILEQGIQANQALTNSKQIDITLETTSSNQQETSKVIITSRADKKVTAVIEENNSTSGAINTYKHIFSTISDPRRLAYNEVTQKFETTLREVEGTQGAPSSSTGQSSSSNTSNNTQGKRDNNDSLAENGIGSLADALKSPTMPLTTDQLYSGLQAIGNNFDSCIKLQKPEQEGSVFNTDKSGTDTSKVNDHISLQTLPTKREKAVFFPIRTGTSASNDTHYVYLCITPDNTAYYYDPLARPLFGDSPTITNGTILGRNQLTETLQTAKKNGDPTAAAIATFCLNNNIQSFNSAAEAHQTDGHNCGPFGLAWFEHLGEKFSQNLKSYNPKTIYSKWSISDPFGKVSNIVNFREQFANRYQIKSLYNNNSAPSSSEAVNKNAQTTPSPSATPSSAQSTASHGGNAPAQNSTSLASLSSTSKIPLRKSTSRALSSSTANQQATQEENICQLIYNNNKTFFRNVPQINQKDQHNIPILIKIIRENLDSPSKKNRSNQTKKERKDNNFKKTQIETFAENFKSTTISQTTQAIIDKLKFQFPNSSMDNSKFATILNHIANTAPQALIDSL